MKFLKTLYITNNNINVAIFFNKNMDVVSL